MGTFGRHAVGSRGQVAYKEETWWGVATPPDQRIDFRTESINNEIGSLTTESIDPTRGISKRVQGVSNVSGDVVYELNTEGYEVWYKHAFGDAITLDYTDGGIRTQATVECLASTGTTLTVGSTAAFETGGGVYKLQVVYKSSTTGLLVNEQITYSAIASTTTFTVTAPTTTIPVGAWVFQDNTTNWTSVYTHYIEAARDLPQGLTVEVGRDVAFFVYSGMKVNTLENTFNAQEILTGTYSFLGKFEHSGGDLSVATTDAMTTIELKNYYLDYYHAAQAIGYAFEDDGAVFADVTSAANDDTADDVKLLGATSPVSGDSFYFGNDEKFSAIEVIISTAATGSPDWTVAWEYYNGTTWVTLPFRTQEITNFEEVAGTYINAWDFPSDWEANTVDSQSAYWIRADLTAGTAGTGPLGQRIYLGPEIIGFGKSGTIQVGAENDIAFVGQEINFATPVAKLLTVSNWASSSTHAINEPVVSQVAWDDPADPPATDMLSSFQAAVYVTDESGNLETIEVMNSSFTLNNNLYTDKYQLGDRARAGLPEQRRTVEGLVHMEFDDLRMYHKFINGTSHTLEVRCVDETEVISGGGEDVYRQFHLIFPNVEFTGTTPQIGGPELLEHDMNFTALRDITNNVNEVVAIFVNTIDRDF